MGYRLVSQLRVRKEKRASRYCCAWWTRSKRMATIDLQISSGLLVRV